ncbi:MAG: tetratricopeptide repeat protein [Cyclobacteriaceae bacterium]
MAQSAFDIARKYKPDQTLVEESSFQYAKVSYELGQPDKAIAELEKILKNFPNSTHTNEIKELLSQAYVNANNFNKAIEYIESLPSTCPGCRASFPKSNNAQRHGTFQSGKL